MTDIQFSLPDLALVITIVECVLTFCMVVIARTMPAPSRTCRIALGALFLAIALDALAMLLIWNYDLKTQVTAHSAIPLIIGSIALASKGPLLYLFIRTLTQPNYTLKRRHLWHALPTCIGIVTLGIYQLDVANMTVPAELNDDTPGAFFWWTMMRASPVIYAIASIIRLRTMNDLYDSHYAGNEYHYSYWIKLLAAGFFIQWSMALMTHIAGQYLPTGAADMLGKTNDMLGLILVNGLLIYSFTLLRTLMPILGSDEPEATEDSVRAYDAGPSHAQCGECQAPLARAADGPKLSAEAHEDKPPTASPSSSTNISAKQAEQQAAHETVNREPSVMASQTAPPPATTKRAESFEYQPTLQTQPVEASEQQALELIASGISDKRLHLIHTLNIEKFARAINHPTKEVSRLINTYYGCSFSEFINAYRTMEAERLLKDPAHQDTPVVEIIGLSGFNSKSAFHRFFKRFTGYSPSEYRALQIARSSIYQA